MRVRFVDVDGIRTRCLMAGSERSYPILLLHGYGGTADVWVRNIDALADEFFVVAPDMVGSGFTSPADVRGGPPQPAAVAHLRKLADKLDFGRFCAMGTSYGSLIAALLYFDLPDRVDRLVINGSGTCFNDDEQLAAGLAKVRENFGPLLAAPSVEGCRNSMIKQCFDPAAVPEEILLTMATAYAQPWMKGAWERGLNGLLDVRASRPYRILDRLESLDVDTLVVWGREDPGAVYESAVAAVKRMPRAELVTFEKCGHKPMFEHAQRFNAVIRAFLGGAAGATASVRAAAS
jgi:pimeloyl-ACP methyl ester carboxylesterase